MVSCLRRARNEGDGPRDSSFRPTLPDRALIAGARLFAKAHTRIAVIVTCCVKSVEPCAGRSTETSSFCVVSETMLRRATCELRKEVSSLLFNRTCSIICTFAPASVSR